MRIKISLPFFIGGEISELIINSPTNIPGVEEPTKNYLFNALRNGNYSTSACFYDEADNYIKKIQSNDIIDNVLLDDINWGISSFYNSIGFQTYIDDNQPAYVNFDGTPETTYGIGDESTVLANVKVFSNNIFRDKLEESGNSRAISFLVDYNQTPDAYGDNFVLCKSLELSFVDLGVEWQSFDIFNSKINKKLYKNFDNRKLKSLPDAGTLNFDLIKSDDTRYVFAIKKIIDDVTNTPTLKIIDGIVFDRIMTIMENGLTTFEMYLSPNFMFYPFQRSNYQAEPDINGDYIYQTPQPVGTFNEDQSVFYVNPEYDGLAIEADTSAVSFVFAGRITNKSLYDVVLSNEDVITRDIKSEDRKKAKSLNRNANIKAEIVYDEIIDKEVQNETLKKYRKPQKKSSALAKASLFAKRK